VDSNKIKFASARQEMFNMTKKKKSALQQIKETKEIAKTNQHFRVGISIVDNARLTVVLPPVQLDQHLVAELNGDIKFENNNGKNDIQGELKLLEDSYLKFYKKFNAAGVIRFESDLTNPYLDVTATYIDDYTKESEGNQLQSIEVAVKIFLKGTVTELGKNFSSNPKNVQVFKERVNIEGNKPDPTLDLSDAAAFIMLGKFKADLTGEDKVSVASNNEVMSLTSSVMGSLVTSFLQGTVGDVVKNFEVKQQGASTKIDLAGKWGKLKWSIGGKTAELQDMSKANLKIEYPIPIINNLIIRAERKDDVIESAGVNNKNNELGIKYRFEF